MLLFILKKLGAQDRTRTDDLLLTKEVLYLLSYLSFHYLYSGAGLENGAGNGVRTRDPQLGRLMLYQLSYSRWQSRK